MITQRTSAGPSEADMYDALLRRDPEGEGVFLVGVRTTGVFCRPTCSARKPRRENVEFFFSARDALHAGYRACKRCRPLDGGLRPPEWIERLLERVEGRPGRRFTDADLRSLGIVPTRARAYFKRRYGMTFHAYCRARRLGEALSDIRRGAQVERIGRRNGFESISGFRDAFSRLFGAPPGRVRDVQCLFADWLDTPLGAMLAIAGDEGLHLLEFVDRRGIERQIATLRRRLGATVVPGSNVHLQSIRRELENYFAGRLLNFRTRLAPVGGQFQLAVWRELRRIAPGETRSYAQLVRAVGRGGAHRAVGRANGDNRIAIAIPCHRVIAADGTLCGYGGGLWRKRWLLDHERSVNGGSKPTAHATALGSMGAITSRHSQ